MTSSWFSFLDPSTKKQEVKQLKPERKPQILNPKPLHSSIRFIFHYPNVTRIVLPMGTLDSSEAGSALGTVELDRVDLL